jgi:OOP family OmpA-OmpF porin
MGTPMLKYLKTPLIVAVMGLGLSACANLYDTAKNTAPAGDSYAKALFKNYMMLADSERREEDWTDANFFSSKALASTGGIAPGPQELAERSLTEANLAELTPARAALVAALDGGASVRHPEAAAMAVAGFDCWMQEAEENIQPDDIAACKKMYMDGMAGLADKPKPKMMAKGPWTVYFDFDSKSIKGSEDSTLITAAATAEQMGNAAIIVTGHTDTAGSDAYNLKLSAARAKAVVEALGQLGISGSRISANATGEKDLAVKTADGVREAKNRRVEIRVAN